MFLKQSTQIKVRVGPFVDATDGLTPETGVTLSGADEAEVLKSDGAATVDISGATWAAVTGADGWYDLTLTTSHTDTVGELVVVVQDDSVCLPVFQRFYVFEESTYDAQYGASATGFDSNGRVDVGSWLGTAVTTSPTTSKPQVDVDSIDDDATAADNLEAAFDGTGYAGGTTKQDVNVVAVSGDTTAADNLEADYDGTGYAKTASTIGTATNITQIEGSDATDQINAAVDTALTDHIVLRRNTAQAGAAGTITLDASASSTDDLYNGLVVAALSGTGAGQARLITDYNGTTKVASVEPNWTTNPSSDTVFAILPSGNMNLRAATQTSVDAIETDTNSLNDTKIPDTLSLANINAEADTALSDYDAPTKAEMDSGFAALNDISTAQVNTEVDTALSDIGLDHLLSASVAGADVTDDSVIAQLVSSSATADWDDFDNTTESLQALRDRGDAAWTTGGGGSITDILNVQMLVPNEIDLANTATWRIGMMLWNAVDDLPSTAEITPGTVSIDRKAIGGTSWSSVVSDAACSESAGIIYYDEVFDSGTGYAEGDSIRLTFKSQKITVSANDYEVTDSTGRIFYTSIRQTERGTDSALLAANVNVSAGVVEANTVQVEGSDATNAINAEVDTALSDYDAPTKAEMDSGFAALNDLSAADVNAEVDSALNTAIPASPTADSVNERLKAIDDKLPSSSYLKGTADSDGGLDTSDKADINAEADTALADYDAPTKTEMDSGFSALNDLSEAQVNAQVDTALTDYDAPTKAELDSAHATTDALITTVDTVVDNIETDTQNIQSRLPTALVSGKMDSDATAISGSTNAADRLEASAEKILLVTVDAGTFSPTTTQFQADDVNGSTPSSSDDYYNGCLAIINGERTDVTDYDGTNKRFTVTAVTAAPSDNDIIVLI